MTPKDKRFVKCMALLIAVAVVVLSVVNCEKAEAAQLQAQSGSSGCSMPYIVDVNPAGNGKYVAVIEVAGNQPKLTVKCGSKKVKPSKIDDHTWSVTLREGKTYKFTSKSGSCKWTVSYKIGG